ncbi:MAG: AI-2E family transporter, partial [Thermoleophilia bacterium]|nr:AI-2E family transporter [Thermoleophilia bacterium]
KAATIVVIGTVLAATLLALLLLVPFVGAIRDLLQSAPDIVEGLRDSDVFAGVGDSGAALDVQEGAQNLAAQIPDAVSEVIGLAGEAFSAAIAVFTITFLALFFLTDVGNLKQALGSVLMPGDRDRWLSTYERITTTVSRWAIGVLIVATIAGTVQGLTAFLLGSSFALALGIVAGVLDMIPNIGATIAAIITSAVLLAEEGLWQAVVMLVVVLVYQQVENNLVTPTIQGKATNISAFFVILGVTVFGALLGILGALVAVPLTAIIQIVIGELTVARRQKVAEAQAALAAGAPTAPG